MLVNSPSSQNMVSGIYLLGGTFVLMIGNEINMNHLKEEYVGLGELSPLLARAYNFNVSLMLFETTR